MTATADVGSITRRRLSAERRRQELMKAASGVFAKRGYEASSVSDLAEVAGVAKALIYDHFASKRDLYIELLRYHASSLLAAVAPPPDAKTPAEFMHRQIGAFFRFVRSNPDAWRMLFREEVGDSEIVSARAEVMASATATIAQAFALTPRWRLTARLSRELALELLAETTKSALNGLAYWWWDHQDVPETELVATAFDILWTGLERLR